MESAVKKKLKTFKDLEFKPHTMANGLRAVMEFGNGYGVSVVRFTHAFDINNEVVVRFVKAVFDHNGGAGYGSYTSSESEWEVAVMHGGKLCYATPITDDVIGHAEELEVTEIMAKVQRLKKNGTCTHGRNK
jgi:hypothetical protein